MESYRISTGSNFCQRFWMKSPAISSGILPRPGVEKKGDRAAVPTCPGPNEMFSAIANNHAFVKNNQPCPAQTNNDFVKITNGFRGASDHAPSICFELAMRRRFREPAMLLLWGCREGDRRRHRRVREPPCSGVEKETGQRRRRFLQDQCSGVEEKRRQGSGAVDFFGNLPCSGAFGNCNICRQGHGLLSSIVRNVATCK